MAYHIGLAMAQRDRLLHAPQETAPDPVQAAYQDLGMHDALRSCAFELPFREGDHTPASEHDLSELTGFYAASVADIALEAGDSWVDPIERGFKTMIGDMDMIGDEKFGAPKPRSAVQALLIRAGVREPEQGKHFAGLPAEFWHGQFLQDYSQGRYAKRSPEESNRLYLARSIHAVYQQFALAPFSYIQQADRLA